MHNKTKVIDHKILEIKWVLIDFHKMKEFLKQIEI
jgi:hypothetical protein